VVPHTARASFTHGAVETPARLCVRGDRIAGGESEAMNIFINQLPRAGLRRTTVEESRPTLTDKRSETFEVLMRLAPVRPEVIGKHTIFES
jgi:hypothetical protein